ncbi:type II secretion protein GspJ [Escherichia coli]|uniref:type II secretion system protein GspJ n=1 Tax=Escherichia coli TaxID=562 RepID=UPI000E038608|nr:type II secretion system protein GspJ [Escherichia coli]STN55705.1 type II secretion protein GspJ [Escherichia coli]
MNSLSRTQKPRAGFTLLEVMVVIVILGVLASLVVPNLLGNKEKADRQKAISDIVALENALDMYRLDNGRYRIHDGYLERLAWPLTDAAGSVKPTMQKLIPADSLRLQFYDGTRWQESWSSVQAIPVAVRMTLHSPQWGEIERIWLLRGPQ